jgi:hypothetical protein
MRGAIQEESVLLLINRALDMDQPKPLDADESFVMIADNQHVYICTKYSMPALSPQKTTRILQGRR